MFLIFQKVKNSHWPRSVCFFRHPSWGGDAIVLNAAEA